MRIFDVKENHIGSAVCEILGLIHTQRQSQRHPATFISVFLTKLFSSKGQREWDRVNSWNSNFLNLYFVINNITWITSSSDSAVSISFNNLSQPHSMTLISYSSHSKISVGSKFKNNYYLRFVSSEGLMARANKNGR